MTNATLIIGVLLIGVVLFGCANQSNSSPFIGCWSTGNGFLILRLDSDNTATYITSGGTWADIGNNQVRITIPEAGGTRVLYFSYSNSTGIEMIYSNMLGTGGNYTRCK